MTLTAAGCGVLGHERQRPEPLHPLPVHRVRVRARTPPFPPAAVVRRAPTTCGLCHAYGYRALHLWPWRGSGRNRRGGRSRHRPRRPACRCRRC